jgi:hypothetical protein
MPWVLSMILRSSLLWRAHFVSNQRFSRHVAEEIGEAFDDRLHPVLKLDAGE